MGYQDKKSECVGCDANTEGTIREEFNWHLCNECYQQALEEERVNND